MDPLIAADAAKIAARAERDLEALVAISSPSGDLHGAEEALALCAAAAIGALAPGRGRVRATAPPPQPSPR